MIVDEDKLKEYYANGGEVYRVTDISPVRDATHIKIYTSKHPYYYNKKTGEYYRGVRHETHKSLIDNELEIYVLKERIHSFVSLKEKELDYYKKFIEKI